MNNQDVPDSVGKALIIAFVIALVMGTALGWFDGCGNASVCGPGEVQSTVIMPGHGFGYICTPRTR